MKSRVILTVVTLIIIMIAIGVFFSLTAPAIAPDDNGLPDDPILESNQSNPGLSYEIEISGAIGIDEIFAVSDANLKSGSEIVANRREIGFNTEGDWLAIIAFPADAEVATYTFEAANNADEVTGYVLAPMNSDALAFDQNATGYITITEIADKKISGDFEFTVQSTDEAEITVEGNFTNIQMRD